MYCRFFSYFTSFKSLSRVCTTYQFNETKEEEKKHSQTRSMLECWALCSLSLCVFACVVRVTMSETGQTLAQCDLDSSIRMSMARPIDARSHVCVRFCLLFQLRRCDAFNVALSIMKWLWLTDIPMHNTQFYRRVFFLFSLCVCIFVCVVRAAAALYIQSEIMSFRFSLTISMNVSGTILTAL